MKHKAAIKDRRTAEATPYYLSLRTITISKIGVFPIYLKRIGQDQGDNKLFKLAAITQDFVYYVDEKEGDENASTIMLNRDFLLVSDNYFGTQDLSEVVENNQLLWMSKAVKYWQQQLQKDI